MAENKTPAPTPGTPAETATAINRSVAGADPVPTETPEADAPAMKDLTGVKYIGSSDIRLISAEDLKANQGIDAKGDLRWTPGSVVSISEMNAATKDFLATQTGEFELV